MDTFDAVLLLVDQVKLVAYGTTTTSPTFHELHDFCRQILSQLPPSASNNIVFGLRAIASDLLVRIESSITAGETSSQIWTDAHMNVLSRQMETIRVEMQGNQPLAHLSSKSAIKIPIRLDADGKSKETLSSPSVKALDYDPRSERCIMLRDFLLDSLAFTAMTDREEQVTEAYTETFDWIFRDNSHAFASWLHSDNAGSMYWINGLPGSGKSTLMRYINEHKRTIGLLGTWAGNDTVTLANFFFWESGTAVQRSQAGLLRSLLYQLLSQQPELIPTVFPDLWGKIWTADARTRIQLTSTWSISDLSTGFLRFFEHDSGRHICLLVDGLDEFEGDHQIMIDLLERARQRPHTKLCVSSRPWAVFQKAFHDIPSLRLQDLTANDMIQFVHGKLNENQSIRELMAAQQQTAAELTNAIVARADGVFLWVSLAVRTVIEKHRADHNLFHIQQLVENLPGSLDNLFHYLLLETHLGSQSRMSRIFQLIRSREVVCDFTRDDDANSLNVWEMSLTSDTIADLDMSSPIQKISDNKIKDLCHQTIADILGHCAGLVEVHQTRAEKQRIAQLRNRQYNTFVPRRKIMYLHRTVKDYLKNEEVWNTIISCLPGFDPHLFHVRATLFQFRFPIDNPRRQRNINEWWPRIVLAMTHARYSLPSSQQSIFDYLNAFDDTLNWYWPPRGGSVALDSWARSCFGTYEERGSTPYPDPFLSLATKFGIAGYVEMYLDTLEYEYEQEKPLLSYAVEYLVHRQSSVYPLSNPGLVDILFKNGENPNLTKRFERQAIKSDEGEQSDEESPVEVQKPKPSPKLKTPWVVALETVQQAHRRGWIEVYDINPEGAGRWARILRAFLNNGADPKVLVQATYKDKKETALGLITRLFDAYRAKEIQLVRDLLLTKLE